jgi:hypothetical protein
MAIKYSAYSNVASGMTTKYLSASAYGADMEAYNSNKGHRKKTTAADRWLIDVSYVTFVDTLSNNEKVIVKVDTANKAIGLALYSVGIDFSNYVGILFGIYAGSGLVSVVQFVEAGALISGTQAISSGNLLRFDYSGGKIKLDYSTDNGANWTNFKTSTGTPSGTYKIAIQAYSQGGGFSEVYKG